jgi:hypothetical protein
MARSFDPPLCQDIAKPCLACLAIRCVAWQYGFDALPPTLVTQLQRYTMHVRASH